MMKQLEQTKEQRQALLLNYPECAEKVSRYREEAIGELEKWEALAEETLSGKAVRVRADIRDPVRSGSLRDAVLPGIPERVFHAGHRRGRDDGAGEDGAGADGRGWKRRNGESCRDGASCRGRRSC